MVLWAVDGSDLPVRGHAGLDDHTSLEHKIGHLWITQQRGSVSDSLGVEDLDGCADLTGRSALPCVNRASQSELSRSAKRLSVVLQTPGVTGCRAAGQVQSYDPWPPVGAVHEVLEHRWVLAVETAEDEPCTPVHPCEGRVDHLGHRWSVELGCEAQLQGLDTLCRGVFAALGRHPSDGVEGVQARQREAEACEGGLQSHAGGEGQIGGYAPAPLGSQLMQGVPAHGAVEVPVQVREPAGGQWNHTATSTARVLAAAPNVAAPSARGSCVLTWSIRSQPVNMLLRMVVSEIGEH